MKIADWNRHRIRFARCAAVLVSMAIVAFTAHAANVTYEVDAAGRVTKATYPDGSFITYSYDVRGNRTGATVSDLGAPTETGALTFTDVTSSTATASWMPATDNVAVTGYQYRLNGGQWTAIAESPAALTGLSAGTLYTFEVRARDAVPLYGPPRSGTFTTFGTGAPTAPGIPSFTNPAATSITASWTAATDDVGIVSYEYSLNGTSWTTNGTLRTKDLTGLSSGVTYTFYVRALDANTAGPASSSTFTTLDNVAPTTPTALGFSDITETSALASWVGSTDNVGVSRYEVSLNGQQWVSNGLSLNRPLTGLLPATLNTLAVRAVDAATNTSAAISNTFNTVDTSPPTDPGIPSFSLITASSATATWVVSTDNVGVARYETSLNGASWTTNGTSNTRNLSGLASGSVNTLRVRAFDAANNESNVTENTFSTVDDEPPSVPGTPFYTSVTGTSATANWDPATDNVGVVSYWYSFNGGTWTSNGASRTLTLSGLTPATTYPLSVRARDSSLDGPAIQNTFATVDTIEPTQPGTITISPPTGNSATASWVPATDNVGVTGYQWRRTGTNYVDIAGTSVSMTGLSPGTTYTFDVRARDAIGNWGDPRSTSFATPTLITISDRTVSTWVPGFGGGFAVYQLDHLGDIKTSQPTNSQEIPQGEWIAPKSGMGNYQVRGTQVSGTCGSNNTWLNLGVNPGPTWGVGRGGPSGTVACVVDIQIRETSNPSVILGTARISLQFTN